MTKGTRHTTAPYRHRIELRTKVAEDFHPLFFRIRQLSFLRTVRQ
ncbi:Uncharacterised protein [Vibrio cholerae]|nr:Uncharacterised protein [Vibrio cholerae]CSI55802.1 Uncharacterised protein [Vibrio cholerae]